MDRKAKNIKGLAARVRSRNQVTLPQDVVAATGLSEGSFLSVSVSDKRTTVPAGTIILSPQELQPRVWTDEEWKAKEAEADEDIKAGRVSGPHKAAETLIADLRSKKLRKK